MADAPAAVPHFTVETLDGQRVSYSSIWQHQNLILLILPAVPSSELRLYAAALAKLAAELIPQDTACIVTADVIAPYDAPALVIADRWGEVRALHEGTLPSMDDVEATLQHVRMACPECEGEWK